MVSGQIEVIFFFLTRNHRLSNLRHQPLLVVLLVEGTYVPHGFMVHVPLDSHEVGSCECSRLVVIRVLVEGVLHAANITEVTLNVDTCGSQVLIRASCLDIACLVHEVGRSLRNVILVVWKVVLV